MLTKTQMKHEIVGQSALSLLASGIRFMEIPQLYPTFDNVFEHAFKECGLDRVYPHVLGLNYSDPQDLCFFFKFSIKLTCSDSGSRFC